MIIQIYPKHIFPQMNFKLVKRWITYYYNKYKISDMGSLVIISTGDFVFEVSEIGKLSFYNVGFTDLFEVISIIFTMRKNFRESISRFKFEIKPEIRF